MQWKRVAVVAVAAVAVSCMAWVGVLLSAGSSTTAADAQEQRWEYMVVRQSSSFPREYEYKGARKAGATGFEYEDPRTEERMDAAGMLGWELVSSIYIPEYDFQVLTFKRSLL